MTPLEHLTKQLRENFIVVFMEAMKKSQEFLEKTMRRVLLNMLYNDYFYEKRMTHSNVTLFSVTFECVTLFSVSSGYFVATIMESLKQLLEFLLRRRESHLKVSINSTVGFSSYLHGSFYVCVQPMRGDIALYRHLSLAGRIHKIIPDIPGTHNTVARMLINNAEKVMEPVIIQSKTSSLPLKYKHGCLT